MTLSEQSASSTRLILAAEGTCSRTSVMIKHGTHLWSPRKHSAVTRRGARSHNRHDHAQRGMVVRGRS